MREIKFRGLRTDGKGWVYGQVHTYGDGTFIAQTGLMSNSGEDWRVTAIEVLPESVGQFIGLKNINGTDIYEGDAVVWKVNDIERTASVYFDEQASCFWMGRDKSIDQLVLNDWMRGEYQVIGNIHENPELL